MKSQEGIIQFVLDNKIARVDFARQKLSPTLTVLNYLRSLPNHKGVKEGCAEGDCGACTVVIAELDHKNKLFYKAINSCLVFLPMINRKQLITVENLATRKNHEVILHPVQQAMVDLNGSQCGYCTPGIVMSMFALYKNYKNPSREIIEDALTGNLCRCTGYQSILKAAKKSCNLNVVDKFQENENEIISMLKSIKSSSGSISIFSLEQKYFQPKSLKECFDLIETNPDVICLNGSTDTALRQTKKFEHLGEIIDLSAIDELKQFRETQTEIIIGSALNLEALKSEITESLPELFQLLKVFGSKQIRNLATLGGNIATASPIGDALPLLIASGANIKLISKKGERILSIENFIKGYRKTDLKKGEIIHSIIIPKLRDRHIRFYKVSKRKDLDISTVSAGFRIGIKKNVVSDICLAFGGMAAMVRRATKTEKYLLNRKWSFESVQAAMAHLDEDFTPLSDARANAEFRMDAAKNLLLKYFEETRNGIISS